jgi:hypothetical protein
MLKDEIKKEIKKKTRKKIFLVKPGKPANLVIMGITLR